ncbi:protoporphyrinogen oxidase HemJ [Pelagibacteraceae bacterium]|jgi:putative membrane protein|nr:protoporphyrinogen oxidase HemJ [Pelagibacteraceae bacterium]
MNYYLLFKSLHLISVISWMAGLLYLPRLFVYHAETQKNEGQKETFKLMEKRLFLYIMNPAMILSWLFGVLLIYSIGVETFVHLWLQLKLAMVILLTFYHFFLFHCLKNFTQNNSKYSPKFYRIINEVPTILLIGIIFIVIFKPL